MCSPHHTSHHTLYDALPSQANNPTSLQTALLPNARGPSVDYTLRVHESSPAATSAPAPSRPASCFAPRTPACGAPPLTGTLSHTQAPSTDGLSVVTPLPLNTSDSDSARPPYIGTALASLNAALRSANESPHPPPFSSLYFPSRDPVEPQNKPCDTGGDDSPPAFAPAPPFTESSSSAGATAVAETKAALPRDTKGSNRKDVDDGEPPPPYSEGSSPLESFAYVMASAGGPASILTQVSQSSAGPPINTLGGSDENITLELRHVLTLFMQTRSRLTTVQRNTLHIVA